MKEIAYTQSDGSSIYSLNIEHYPAGEPIVKGAFVPDRILMRPRSLQSFFEGLLWVDALAERGYKVPPLILPCVPGARQDRLQDDQRGGDFLCTLKSLARELNARNFPSVTVLDPHSYVTSALIDRCRVIPSVEVFRTIPCSWDAVIAPDGGAEKRAEAVGQLYNIPTFHAWKIRDQKTGKLSGFGCEEIPASYHSLLMVDDLCDGGGTFVGLAEHIASRRRSKYSIDLFTTHGYYTKGVGELQRHFNRIITTDSLLIEHDPSIEVRPICIPLLGGLF